MAARFHGLLPHQLACSETGRSTSVNAMILSFLYSCLALSLLLLYNLIVCYFVLVL